MCDAIARYGVGRLTKPDVQVRREEIVLADEEDWGIEYSRQVHRLVESSLLGRTITEERNRHITALIHLCREASTQGDRDGCADDWDRSMKAILTGNKMHRPAHPSGDTGIATEHFSKETMEAATHRQEVSVRSVRAKGTVRATKMQGDTDRRSFLTDRQMAWTRDGSIGDSISDSLFRTPDH
jgi:hypothetical protein